MPYKPLRNTGRIATGQGSRGALASEDRTGWKSEAGLPPPGPRARLLCYASGHPFPASCLESEGDQSDSCADTRTGLGPTPRHTAARTVDMVTSKRDASPP